jgi:hypothetical protein
MDDIIQQMKRHTSHESMGSDINAYIKLPFLLIAVTCVCGVCDSPDLLLEQVVLAEGGVTLELVCVNGHAGAEYIPIEEMTARSLESFEQYIAEQVAAEEVAG